MQRFNSFTKELEQKILGSNLPGLSSQLKMAPVNRLREMKAKSLQTTNMKTSSLQTRTSGELQTRTSAVLILFYPKGGKPHIALIKRATDNTVHSGQISFPGGKVEKSDDSLIHTALREANEEVGIITDAVNIIGQLTKLYIPPSNFDVFPIIGATYETPTFSINREVEKVLEVNMEELINPNNYTQKKIQHRNGNEVDVPCYFIQDEIVWGATAMIISELLDVIG
ncbi:MAG: CoA pyrophosphatase [Bacteroidetes bacterium]|nr:CoA pyrophosphatase [Bacteroidota bacterium]